jgi:hypothetical protein
MSGEMGKYTGRLMKKQLPGYYRPTNEDIESLWNNGLIILDTNVLLDLYRISKPSSDLFLSILNKYSSQLWLPNQVESEFHKHRNEVIIEQKESYSELILCLERCNSAVSTKLKEYSRHPFIENNKISDPVEKTISSVITDLQTLEKEHPDLISDDPILDEINILYKEKIGEGYSKERLQEIYDEGKIRYERKIPPGFKDQAKSKNHENEEFGDLILWYQIIDKARLSKKPIIFVTSEKKVDWWNKIKGQKIGPNPELIEEIQNKANVQFYMYSSDRFALFAQERLKQTVNPDTLTELREIRNKEGIAEVIRDEEVRIEADRDSFVIGRSVEIFGYANTNENYVRLFLYGPSEFSEGLEVATPAVDNSNRWRYSWNPGYSIQAGLYSFVVFDSRKKISDEISVKAEKGAVTIVASGAQSYYIGEKIKIGGTSTASKSVFLAIRGERASLNIRKLDDISIISVNNNEQSFLKINVKRDCTWSYIWDTSVIGKLLRPGFYTIYAIEGPFIPNNVEDKAYGSVSIIIKKPFISLTISQSIVPQGDRIFFTGVAEGVSRQKIQIWIFSDSFFYQEIIHVNSDSSFMFQLSPTQTKKLPSGQYFLIVQHPMEDNRFDVYVDEFKKSVFSNFPREGTQIFSLEGPDSLHGLNAAMAVCNAIKNPNSDDTYVKGTFLVEPPVLRLNPIDKKYAGDHFKILGFTNISVESEILIEVYPSAFDPEMKNQQGFFSGCSGIVKIIKSKEGYNEFSFNVDAASFTPDTYVARASIWNFDLITSASFLIEKPSLYSKCKKTILRCFGRFYRIFR